MKLILIIVFKSTRSDTTMQGTKRKRLVLSCLECRRRKMKCDRQMPTCSRCLEIGQAGLCKYDERERILYNEQESDARSQTSSSRRISKLDTKLVLNVHDFSAQNPLRALPTTPAASSANTNTSHASTTNAPSSEVPPNDALVKGNGFRTHYHGPSNPSSILFYVGFSFPDR